MAITAGTNTITTMITIASTITITTMITNRGMIMRMRMRTGMLTS